MSSTFSAGEFWGPPGASLEPVRGALLLVYLKTCCPVDRRTPGETEMNRDASEEEKTLKWRRGNRETGKYFGLLFGPLTLVCEDVTPPG